MEELLYTETDDSCAICGARRPEWLTIHHIDGNRTNSTYDNQIVLCHNCHHQHHTGKGLTQAAIVSRKRRLIRKTLTQYGINALKIANRSPQGVMGLSFLLYHLVGMGYMSEQEAQMTYGDLNVTVRFTITQLGTDLLKKWKL